MADLFDLFEDAGEPQGTNQEHRTALAPVPDSLPPAAPKVRTWLDHPCEEPGCKRWGAHGLFHGNVAASRWWCRAHLPTWFYAPHDREADRLAPTE